MSEKIKSDICVILENIEHMENIGSIFRLADTFHINGVYIVSRQEFNFKRIGKTARNYTKDMGFLREL